MLPSTTWNPVRPVITVPREVTGIRVRHEDTFIRFATVERSGAPITVGRHPSCDIVLSHESVSRLHCRFVRTFGETFIVEDAGSRFGVIVRALGPCDHPSRIDWAPLSLGGHIELGAVVLVLVDDDGHTPFVPASHSQWQRESNAMYGVRRTMQPTTVTSMVRRRQRRSDVLRRSK